VSRTLQAFGRVAPDLFVNPSFAKHAEICGALGIRVEARADLDAALERALAHDGPSLVEVVSDTELV
jgi:pyruvate oxidase